MRKWGFFKWTRDNQRAFADAVAAELDSKASKDTVDDLLAKAVSKTGDTISGKLIIKLPPGSGGEIYPITIQGQFSETSLPHTWHIGMVTYVDILYFRCASKSIVGIGANGELFPAAPVLKSSSLGMKTNVWKRTYTTLLNNGADIEIPAKAGTMALVADIEDILRQHGLIPPETNEPNEQQQGVENA